jgi:hypothetical protein
MTVEPFGPAGAFLLSDEEVAAVGGGAKAFPVTVEVNGHTLDLRLTRMGGANCIGLRRELRDLADLVIGSDYDVVIRKDDRERTVEVPDDLAAALVAAEVADRFAALALSHRKEFVRWILDAKRPATRASRVATAVEMVRNGTTR